LSSLDGPASVTGDEAQRQALERYRTLVEADIVGVVLATPTGGVIDANDYYLRTIGYTREEFEQGLVDWRAITPPEWLPADERAIQELRERGRCTPYEKQYARRDGTSVWVSIANVMLPGPEEQIVAFVLDVTEMKRVQSALREREEQFRVAQEFSPDGFTILRPLRDAQGRVVDFAWVYENATIARLNGTDPSAVVGRRLLELFPEHRGTQFMKAYQQVAESGEPSVFESDFSDERIPEPVGFRIVVVPMGGDIAVFAQDITDRRRTEKALRRQAQRLRNLHAVDNAILRAVDPPEVIAHAALQHLRDMLQCQSASVGLFDAARKTAKVISAQAKPESNLRIGSDLPQEVYGYTELLVQGEIEPFEGESPVHPMLRAQGIQSSINIPLHSERGLIGALNVGWETPTVITPEDKEIAGEVAGQIAIAIEQDRLLRSMKSHAEELEQRVRERTAALETANKELEAFSYSVSHDLRAPLRAVDGYSRILLEDYANELDAEGRRVCSVIIDSARDMGKLIDDLLAFSRVGRTEMHRSVVDMATLAESIFFELTTPQSRARIDFEVGPTPSMPGDSNLLRLVWMNLLSNAVKFSSKQQQAVIRVSAAQQEGECVYSVSDNGAGFDMQYSSKLFGVFQRLHSTREFEGTGVGLAIVQRIVHRHGGRVWAEGEIGKGATFHMAFKQGE